MAFSFVGVNSAHILLHLQVLNSSPPPSLSLKCLFTAQIFDVDYEKMHPISVLVIALQNQCFIMMRF